MKYSKQCPTCGAEISYVNKYTMTNSKNLNKSCRSCSHKRRIERDGINEGFRSFIGRYGDKNPFYGRKHGEGSKVNTPEFREKMSKISSGSNNPMYGKTVYQVWVEKYGKEEADLRMLNLKEKQRINSTGEKNPMYGKPSPNGSGNGWSGWYKSWYFRSLRELSYVIDVIESNNLVWESAESIRIPYIDWDGSSRTYSPDFIINNNKLIEIKPERLKASKSVILKKEAAEKFCESIGWSYELIDQPRMANERIKILHDSGQIKFIERYELKFLELNGPS